MSAQTDAAADPSTANQRPPAQIAGLMVPSYVAGTLPLVMEQAMLAQPADWDAYYVGSLSELKLQRQFSYSDRIRYYWAKPKAQAAVANLFAALADVTIPETLISHYLSRLYPGVVMGTVRPQAQNLAVAAIQSALSPYTDACRSRASAQKRNA